MKRRLPSPFDLCIRSLILLTLWLVGGCRADGMTNRDSGTPPLDQDSGVIVPPRLGDGGSGETRFAVSFFDGVATDSARNREVAYRLYFPVGASGSLPVLIFSHGGTGSSTGYKQNGHMGKTWAAAGFLGFHLNHLPSSSTAAHQRDRPQDVTFFLNQLEAGALRLPNDLTATADLSRVGHCGHSWGAYTSHAVGGATFQQGRFTDARIKAIAPISPQGPGQFGSFDRGPTDNTWVSVALPAYTLLGAVEKDGPTTNPREQLDWRVFPFNRYPPTPDRFLSIVPGADHDDMMNKPGVTEFVAENTLRFFLAYVANSSTPCGIGEGLALPNTETRKKTEGGPASGCP
jgi:hypothetical protein